MPSPEIEESAQVLECEPQMNILFSAPDFTVPSPDKVDEIVNPDNIIFN